MVQSLLVAAGALTRKGSVENGSSLCDAAPEARSRQMTIEPDIACCSFLDDPWIFLDCPGSVELAQETLAALMVADIAIVVAEPDPARAVVLVPLLKDRKSTRLNSSH